MEGRARPSVEGPRLRIVATGPGGDRADMVRELRERIDAGSYDVDPGRVAEAMLVRMRREPASSVFVALETLDGDSIGVQQRESAARFDLA